MIISASIATMLFIVVLCTGFNIHKQLKRIRELEIQRQSSSMIEKLGFESPGRGSQKKTVNLAPQSQNDELITRSLTVEDLSDNQSKRTATFKNASVK